MKTILIASVLIGLTSVPVLHAAPEIEKAGPVELSSPNQLPLAGNGIQVRVLRAPSQTAAMRALVSMGITDWYAVDPRAAWGEGAANALLDETLREVRDPASTKVRHAIFHNVRMPATEAARRKLAELKHLGRHVIRLEYPTVVMPYTLIEDAVPGAGPLQRRWGAGYVIRKHWRGDFYERGWVEFDESPEENAKRFKRWINYVFELRDGQRANQQKALVSDGYVPDANDPETASLLTKLYEAGIPLAVVPPPGSRRRVAQSYAGGAPSSSGRPSSSETSGRRSSTAPGSIIHGHDSSGNSRQFIVLSKRDGVVILKDLKTGETRVGTTND